MMAWRRLWFQPVGLQPEREAWGKTTEGSIFVPWEKRRPVFGVVYRQQLKVRCVTIMIWVRRNGKSNEGNRSDDEKSLEIFTARCANFGAVILASDGIDAMWTFGLQREPSQIAIIGQGVATLVTPKLQSAPTYAPPSKKRGRPSAPVRYAGLSIAGGVVMSEISNGPSFEPISWVWREYWPLIFFSKSPRPRRSPWVHCYLPPLAMKMISESPCERRPKERLLLPRYVRRRLSQPNSSKLTFSSL